MTLRKCLFGLAAVVLACSTAFADSITFQTPAGTNETTGGQPVSAQALVTTGNGFVTVQLWNLLEGSNSISNAGQLLSDFEFTLNSSLGTVEYATGTSGSAALIHIGSGGVVTSAGSTSTLGWGLSESGSTILLNGLGGSNTPSDLLVGGACSDGTYCNANSSIAANGPHNPFATNSATFTIDATGVTSSSDVTGATFSFGTASGDNVNGIPITTVPEPSSYLLLGAGLLVFGLSRRRVASLG